MVIIELLNRDTQGPSGKNKMEMKIALGLISDCLSGVDHFWLFSNLTEIEAGFYYGFMLGPVYRL